MAAGAAGWQPPIADLPSQTGGDDTWEWGKTLVCPPRHELRESGKDRGSGKGVVLQAVQVVQAETTRGLESLVSVPCNE
jgi:hypothetical protein